MRYIVTNAQLSVNAAYRGNYVDKEERDKAVREAIVELIQAKEVKVNAA